MGRVPEAPPNETHHALRPAPVTVGTEGILHFWNHHTDRWCQLLMTVTRADNGRMRLKVLKPGLPYPAKWNLRKLLPLEEVWFMADGLVIRGRPATAVGKNITLSGLSFDSLPTT